MVIGLGMAGGAHGWIAGRAGFWGALATWVWGQQSSPQVPGHPTSIYDAGINSTTICYLQLLMGLTQPFSLSTITGPNEPLINQRLNVTQIILSFFIHYQILNYSSFFFLLLSLKIGGELSEANCPGGELSDIRHST